MIYSRKTVDEIRLSLLQSIGATDLDSTRGSYLDNIVSATASEIASLYQAVNVLISKDDPNLMDVETLTNKARQIGIHPLLATHALISVKYDGEKPKIGSVFSINNNLFTFIREDSLDTTTNSNTIRLIAEASDTGNIRIVQGEKIVSLPQATGNAYVYYVLDSGRDDETVTELRARYKSNIGMPIANNATWFKTEALKVRGVGYAKIVRTTSSNISVKRVEIYAGTSDFKPVSQGVINYLTDHFSKNAIIGTQFVCGPITNTDDYYWKVVVSTGGVETFQASSIESIITQLITDFISEYNQSIPPGTQPTLSLSRVGGYILSKMYDTSYSIVSSIVTISKTGEPDSYVTKINLTDETIITFNYKNLQIVIEP
jgi:uncharacterized phage protein gp47/JayE